MPFLFNGFHLLDALLGTICYGRGEDQPSLFYVEIILGLVIVLNLTAVNYFMLKLAGIAALQRCATP